VLAQLGNRVQHALRAFTPRDQKAVKAAAETLRANPKFDAETAIQELGVGEALVSFLDAKGTPNVVERALVLPPASRIGPLTADERGEAIRNSVLYGHYEKALDRESAYEKLKGTLAQGTNKSSNGPGSANPSSPQQTDSDETSGGFARMLGGLLGGGLMDGAAKSGSRGRQTVVEAAVKSAARAIGSQLGREIIRGVLGSVLGGRRR
jgi:hypothetical protein